MRKPELALSLGPRWLAVSPNQNKGLRLEGRIWSGLGGEGAHEAGRGPMPRQEGGRGEAGQEPPRG